MKTSRLARNSDKNNRVSPLAWNSNPYEKSVLSLKTRIKMKFVFNSKLKKKLVL
jgi:hypothetical protein